MFRREYAEEVRSMLRLGPVARLLVLLALTVSLAAPVASAAPPPETFVAVLSADEEVPPCAAATNASRGEAVFHVRDRATGTVDYKLVANNLPASPVAPHIHLPPK